MPTTVEYAALLRAAIAGDLERARELAECAAVSLRKTNKSQASRLIESALRSQPFRALPLQTSDAVVVTPAACQLDDLIVTRVVRQTIERLLAEQEAVKKLQAKGFEPMSRLLIHGPPGNGKTSLAHGVANQLGCPLLVLSMPDCMGSHMGELTKKFAAALKSVKNFGRCVFLIDEADTLLLRRGGSSVGCDVENSRCTSVALTELERLGSQVVTIAATNLIDNIDPALFRRFDVVLQVPQPTGEALRTFATALSAKYGVDLSGLSLGENFATAKQAVISRAKDKCLLSL